MIAFAAFVMFIVVGIAFLFCAAVTGYHLSVRGTNPAAGAVAFIGAIFFGIVLIFGINVVNLSFGVQYWKLADQPDGSRVWMVAYPDKQGEHK